MIDDRPKSRHTHTGQDRPSPPHLIVQAYVPLHFDRDLQDYGAYHPACPVPDARASPSHPVSSSQGSVDYMLAVAVANLSCHSIWSTVKWYGIVSSLDGGVAMELGRGRRKGGRRIETGKLSQCQVCPETRRWTSSSNLTSSGFRS